MSRIMTYWGSLTLLALVSIACSCATNANGVKEEQDEAPSTAAVQADETKTEAGPQAVTSADEVKGEAGKPLEIGPDGMALMSRSEASLPTWTTDRFTPDEDSFIVVGKASHLGTLYPAQLKAMEDAVRDILVRSIGSADGVEVISEWVNDGEGNRRVKLVAKLPVKEGVIEVSGFHLEKIYYETWKHGDQTLFVSWMQVSWKKSIFRKVLKQIAF